jgi:hypothetical protein
MAVTKVEPLVRLPQPAAPASAVVPSPTPATAGAAQPELPTRVRAGTRPGATLGGTAQLEAHEQGARPGPRRTAALAPGAQVEPPKQRAARLGPRRAAALAAGARVEPRRQGVRLGPLRSKALREVPDMRRQAQAQVGPPREEKLRAAPRGLTREAALGKPPVVRK